MSKYRILVLKNGTNIDVNAECIKATTFFATRPTPIEVGYIQKTISIPVGYKVYKTVQGFSSTTGQPLMVDYLGLVDTVKDQVRTLVKEFECNSVMIVNDISTLPVIAGKSYPNWTNFQPLYFSATARTGYMQVTYTPYIKQQGKLYNAIIHEVMHDFVYTLNQFGYPCFDSMDVDSQGRPYYKNDTPEAPDGNFSQTFASIKPYLSKLVPPPIIDVGYRYFSPSEIIGLKPELVKLLDQARGIAGIPFKITSGYRTVAENTLAGGVNGSTHTLGLGVDLFADTSEKRFKIVSGAIKVGFNRIGVYNNHVHLDIGVNPAFPQNVLWNLNKD